MSKHTPGPWRIERRQNVMVGPKSYEIRTAVDGKVGFLIANVNMGSSDVAANAELIANAPALLAEVEQLKLGMRKINTHLGLPPDAGWAHTVNAIEGLKKETA